MRQAQALHLVEALEYKGGLQVTPRDDWGAPGVRVLPRIMACLHNIALFENATADQQLGS